MTDKRKIKQQKSNRKKEKQQTIGSERDEFRKKNKDSNGHPNYIYRKVGNNFEYIGMTHSSITRGVKNIKLDTNPDKTDDKPSYFKPRPERASTKTFKNHVEKGMRLSESDRKKADEIKKKPIKDKNPRKRK